MDFTGEEIDALREAGYAGRCLAINAEVIGLFGRHAPPLGDLWGPVAASRLRILVSLAAVEHSRFVLQGI